MRTNHQGLNSGLTAGLCGLAVMIGSFACGQTITTVESNRAPELDPIYSDTIEVEVALTPEEIAAARAAAVQLARVDENGVVVVPPIATTRMETVLKSDYYAPPTDVCLDAKQLVHYFCKAWKDEDYERMYYAMDRSYRKKVSFADFEKRFKDDAEMNGGLDDENIRSEVEPSNKGIRLTVTLRFVWPRVGSRVVRAEAVQSKDGFRLVDSGIIPAAY